MEFSSKVGKGYGVNYCWSKFIHAHNIVVVLCYICYMVFLLSFLDPESK